ncbi:hypothetical protein [Rhizobium leguminosarum]|nr:hypothetical protein [Rhizobium leguminosarum]
MDEIDGSSRLGMASKIGDSSASIGEHQVDPQVLVDFVTQV